MIVAKLNHHLYIILTTHHMITIELDMNYVYYIYELEFKILNTLDIDSK